MQLYELIDVLEAPNIVVLNKPYTETFFMLKIENGNTNDVNGLVWDAIEDSDITSVVVGKNGVTIYLDEENISIDSAWDESGKVDFYALEKGKADADMQELAKNLGIYITD